MWVFIFLFLGRRSKAYADGLTIVAGESNAIVGGDPPDGSVDGSTITNC